MRLFKVDSHGRLLTGYGCRLEEKNFFIHGLINEERVNSCGLDEDGFLVAD